MKFVDTFEKHNQEPNKLVVAYVKEKRVELGTSLLDTKKIYLDTKYWLLLRDAKLGRARDEKQLQMLALAEQLAASGRYIFPICEDVFVEILKQIDPATLKSTVALMSMTE